MRGKKYTDEELKERQKEQRKKYYEKNKEKIKKQHKERYQKNREKILEKDKKYRLNSPIGRASRLLESYKQKDKKYNRGEGDLTTKWIVENIFTKPCAHCGETDWHKIGCNRLDNSKPHTKDNVEPCCKECNDRLGNPPKKVLQYNTNGELINIYSSLKEVSKALNVQSSNISKCCNNVPKYKTAYGYIWKFE